jgi:hypothetical protein
MSLSRPVTAAFAHWRNTTPLGARIPEAPFHPNPCLVGMALVSNFILLERYAPDRSAATWTRP